MMLFVTLSLSLIVIGTIRLRMDRFCLDKAIDEIQHCFFIDFEKKRAIPAEDVVEDNYWDAQRKWGLIFIAIGSVSLFLEWVWIIGEIKLPKLKKKGVDVPLLVSMM